MTRRSDWRGRVIVLASGKGGAGKTSLCASMAAELLSRGERVALVDADPQQMGGLRQWWEAGEGLRGAALTVEAGERAAAAARELARDAAVIVDTAGALTRTLLALIGAADLVLIPARPGGLDAARAAELVQLVGQTTSAPCAVVLNGCARSAMPAHIRAELEAVGVRVLRAEIGQRVAFPTSQLFGSAPATMGAGARAAAAEIRALVDETRRLLR